MLPAILAACLRRGVDVTLTICGHGPDHESLVDACRSAGLSHLIEFPDVPEQEGLYETYRQHHVLLLAEQGFRRLADDQRGGQHLLFLFVDDADLELVMGLGVEQDGRSVTVRQRRGDGSLVWVQMQLGVERDAEGMPCGLMARVIDVNEQVIESEQNRLRGRVFDLMPQPCVITDVQGRAVSANPAWFRMAGAGPEGVLGQTVPLLERRPEAAAFWAGFDALQATTGSWLGERPVPSPDGEERPAYVSIARLVGELGATVGYFITVLGPGADRALSADTGRPRPLRSAAFQAMLSR
jgi:PAS domain S-box-containing protein